MMLACAFDSVTRPRDLGAIQSTINNMLASQRIHRVGVSYPASWEDNCLERNSARHARKLNRRC